MARRAGEDDYNNTYSFIGGKLEIDDGGILAGLKREKNEEVGESFIIKIQPHASYNVYFVKNSGRHMIIPHYFAQYVGGEVTLNHEYSDYKWVKLTDLADFEPKIENIAEVASRMLDLYASFKEADFVTI